jgi:cysteine desulfurase
MTKNVIYLDYNASAPLRESARLSMIAALDDTGNASSIHGFGRTARKRVEDARALVGALVGASAKQVIFTSGATESNNTIISGFTGRILISAIEHPSVLEPAMLKGAEKIPVTSDGLVNMAALETMLESGPTPSLISIMLVNSETGVIQPVADIAQLARRYGAAVHCDAVQAAGKIPVSIKDLGVDFLTLSAHKIGGPQGAGAIITSDGSTVCLASPVLLHGGGQERRLRAGTENVAAIAGFGAAAIEAKEQLQEFAKLITLRDQLQNIVQQTSPGIIVHGINAPRVANTVCFSVPDIAAETMLMALDLDGVAISSGSACSSGTVKVSHVLKAMDVPQNLLTGALRISLGWATTQNDIEKFGVIWQKIMTRLGTKKAS